MNELIKWSYLTDLTKGLVPILTILATITFTVGIILFMFCDEEKELPRKTKQSIIFCLILTISFLVVTFFIPSEQTMLLITISKIPNSFVQTEEGTKEINVLNNKLDKYLNDN